MLRRERSNGILYVTMQRLIKSQMRLIWLQHQQSRHHPVIMPVEIQMVFILMVFMMLNSGMFRAQILPAVVMLVKNVLYAGANTNITFNTYSPMSRRSRSCMLVEVFHLLEVLSLHYSLIRITRNLF